MAVDSSRDTSDDFVVDASADQHVDAPAADRGADGMRADGPLSDGPLSDGADGSRPDATDGPLADGPEVDGAQADGAQADSSSDLVSSDGGDAGDASIADSGVVDANNAAPISGYITRSAAPVLDGRGLLYIGLIPVFPPVAVAEVVIPAADMRSPTARIPYAFLTTPTPGDYTLYAFLDDSGDAAGPLYLASPGDLAMATAVPIKVTAGGNVRQDLDLSVVVGGATDAGIAGDGGPTDALRLGALNGKISMTAAPQGGDGKGNIYLGLFEKWPAGGRLFANATIPAADLSSPYASVPYFFGNLDPGNYYLYVWMDDNNNYNLFAPGPDSTDLTHSRSYPVRIESGRMLTQDVVLDTSIP
jgi:hypothetical protein